MDQDAIINEDGVCENGSDIPLGSLEFRSTGISRDDEGEVEVDHQIP